MVLTNSSRWTDIETRNLLDIWGRRYSTLRLKKRNFKDWELIARDFNSRCQMNGSAALGPRTGNQCKIRIKNMLSEYKKAKTEGPGNSKQSFPFFDAIESILNRCDQQPDQYVDQLDDCQEVKEGENITLRFPAEVQVTGRQQVSVGTATESSSIQEMAVSPVNTVYTGPTILLPQAASGDVSTKHLSQNNGMETQLFETNQDQQRDNTSSHGIVNRGMTHKRVLAQKRKLRKNPRPVKVVKVTGQVNKDDKLLAVVREFMEERRKREEELFDKLFQQQAEAEKRYQEFTLNVIREIGRLFRPEAFSNN